MNSRERKYYEQGRRDGADLRGTSFRELRRSLAQTLQLPEAEAVRQTVENYNQRLEAIPPLGKFPELRGARECVVAYNQGMADGAGAELTDVVLRANYLHAITASYRSPVHAVCTTPPPGCTLVYFPRSDRGALLANNNDGTIRWKHRNEPSWIVANRAGLVVGCVSSGIFDDEVSPEQFPAPVYHLTYERCGTVDEAVDLMTRLNLFWGPCNALVADRHGNSAVIEKSTCRYGLRKSADGFSATTEMAAEEPEFKKYLWETRERSVQARKIGHDCADWAYWQTCERRSARLLRLVDEAKREPTFERMQSIIYDHIGQPEQVHMDGTKCHPDQEQGEWSLRTTIWMLNERRAIYSFAEPPLSGHLTPRHTKDFRSTEPVF